MRVSITEAKANLSNLINRVLQGEKITLTRYNKPMVDLVIHQSKK
ncbi:MAG: hypothetical protein Ctma_0959 [Catillopecten margaritatus gill symbiont]|uniref:Antitoxin n=1 Tax=Catillopecten margaritatus gill symbiont TaxID=3083288 RepID=A0AAU6PGZ6_9GAMM